MIHQSNQIRRKPQILSKIIKNQEGILLMKYGHAYFPLRSIQKQKVSERIRSLLNSYPCWFIKQSLIRTNQFQQILKHIVLADPKQLYVFQEKQQAQQLHPKIKILSSIDAIKFRSLKVMHIMLTRDNNFQQISWLDSPALQQIYISTQGCFTSLKPLQKTVFKQLYMINFRCSGQNTKAESKMFNLNNFHRTKFLNNKFADTPKAKIYTPPGTLTVCRMDLSNIAYLCKLQIQRLTNFHVPHLELSNNQHHHFTPNAEYPWCPQLQFSQSKLYKILNNRFDNKTIALSIIDYVFGQVFDEDMGYNDGHIGNNFQQNDDIEDYQVDSDLDGNPQKQQTIINK